MSKKSVLGKLVFFSTMSGLFAGVVSMLLFGMGNSEFFADKGTIAIVLSVATALMIISAFMFKSNLDDIRDHL